MLNKSSQALILALSVIAAPAFAQDAAAPAEATQPATSAPETTAAPQAPGGEQARPSPVVVPEEPPAVIALAPEPAVTEDLAPEAPAAEEAVRDSRPARPQVSSLIERDAGERFIHRRIGAAVARDPALVAQRGGKGLTQRQSAVLGRMVLIDMQIAIDLHRHVDQRMPGKLFDHVIQKTDAGGDIVSSRPVEIDLDEDPGFRSVALYTACTHGCRARAAGGRAQGIARIGMVKKRLTREARSST